MNKPIYLDKKDVPSQLIGGYAGQNFKVFVVTEVTVPIDAGLWSGGSRETYSFVELATGRSVPSPAQSSAPWSEKRQELNVPLPIGIVMRVHYNFCGQTSGLELYVHPDNASKLLPEPRTELTGIQKIVLEATSSLKASYNGKDRYENSKPYGSLSQGEVAAKIVQVETIFANKGNVMLRSGKLAGDRIEELKAWDNFFPSREEWESAKAELIALGLLNKAGAITVKGKNAV